MAYIEIRDVCFTYPNGGEALQKVSLQLEKGEKVAIVGQNGAGKTTLMKLINGLLKPTEGHVFIEGKDTSAISAAKISKWVGYVFQNPDDQIFNKDVYDEIAFGPKRLGLDKESFQKRVHGAAKLCGLEKLLDDNPYDISLPIRKFVAIASVIAMDADVVILDEPTAGQDQRGMERLSSIIGHLINEGKTVIVITHDMKFVASHFDRCVVMAHKHKIADGEIGTVFSSSQILEEARLKQPYMGSLCDRLGLPERFFTVEELADYIEMRCVDKKQRPTVGERGITKETY